MKTNHVIACCNTSIRYNLDQIDAIRLQIENEKNRQQVAHEGSIWHRWFKCKFKPMYTNLDYELFTIQKRRDYIDKFLEISYHAHYYLKSGITWIPNITDSWFTKLFYEYCSKNNLPNIDES